MGRRNKHQQHQHQHLQQRRNIQKDQSSNEASLIEKPIMNGSSEIKKDPHKISEDGPTFFELIFAQLSFSDAPAAFSTNTGQKHERIYNFLHVPQRLEKFLFVGYLICLDSFLYNLTILPMRMLASIVSLLTYLLSLGRIPFVVKPWKIDFIQILIIGIVCTCLTFLDSSRLYHSIRGQSVLKLYVIYNLFEILDKLCCSFGLDILDAFFARFSKESAEESSLDSGDASLRLRPFPHFILSLVYTFIHSVVLFYQVITLNVSINSFSNALLTLLVSNQFVEIKSAVFKKFKKENLFQLSCADVVERFQLTLYIVIIGGRNLCEIGWGMDGGHLIHHLLFPLALVYLSEILVDWLKHAFITKFNHIHPEVYGRFVDILCKDMLSNSPTPNKIIDQSSVVSRRIGFSVFPLTCLTIRIFIQILSSAYSTSASWVLFQYLATAFVFLFFFKLFIGAWLAIYCVKNQVDEHQNFRTKSLSHNFADSKSDLLKGDPKHAFSQGNMPRPEKPSTCSLDNIDRYTLFKSRIP